MTAFGKILVFLNLVFALLTGGLIGMVYLTRTNWKDAYDKMQAAVESTSKDYQQMLAEEVKKAAFQTREADKFKNAAKETNDKLTAAEDEKKRLNDQLAATKRTNDDKSENVNSITIELNKRRDEVKQLNETTGKFANRIRDLEKQLTDTRDESVTWKLKYDSLKEKNSVLLTQNEEMAREVGLLRSRGISTAGAKRQGAAAGASARDGQGRGRQPGDGFDRHGCRRHQGKHPVHLSTHAQT